MHFKVILNGNGLKPMPQKKFEGYVNRCYQRGDKIEFKLYDYYPSYVEIQAVITTKGVA